MEIYFGLRKCRKHYGHNIGHKRLASAYSAKVGKIISYIDNIMGMPVISDLLDELFSMYYYSYEIDQVEEMESILDWKE